VIGICLFVFDAIAPTGPEPHHSRGLEITQHDAPQSAGLLWTTDQLVAEKSNRRKRNNLPGHFVLWQKTASNLRTSE